MAENQESNINIIESLALVTDAMQTIFPNGKMICVYELDNEDYKKVQENFRKIDQNHNRFSVDISGLEHVFINEDKISLVEKEEIKEEKNNEKPPKGIVGKMSSWFERGGGSVK